MPQHKGKISKLCKFHSKEKVQKSYHAYFKAAHYKTQFCTNYSSRKKKTLKVSSYDLSTCTAVLLNTCASLGIYWKIYSFIIAFPFLRILY